MPQIEWKEWGRQAFQQAKKEDKLVLLDIFGKWCHWCKRMEKETYSDRDIINLVNEKFVPIKVNADERPDINERYNLGGWPTTAILTPEAEIATGGTYAPPEQLYGLLVQVLEIFKKDRERFEKFVKDHKRTPKPLAITKANRIEKAMLQKIDEAIQKSFDEENWGFGFQPKFPITEATDYCLLRGKTKPEMMEIGEKSLLGEKKIFDEDEGGYFRYAVNRDWSNPHCEKMLETNTLLLENNLDAFTALKKDCFKQTAEETIEYLLENLSDEQGWFYGSQEADEKYYKLDILRRKETKKPETDKTLYTSTNCQTINAFLKAGKILEKPELEKHALKALEFLLQKCFDPDKGTSHYWKQENGAEMFGMLADNVYLAEALLKAFETTQQKPFLEQAQRQTELTMKKFWDKNQKALADTAEENEKIGYLKFSRTMLKENCKMAEILCKLSMLAEKREYWKKAGTLLASLQKETEKLGVFACPFGTALEQYLNPLKITVRGNKKLFGETFKAFEPRAIRKFEEKGEGITVCIGTKCLETVKTVQEMEKQLEKIK